MRVRFWGTRGSFAKPGPSTLRYGGNTACVEVRAGDGTLLVFDCGTGAHGFGQSLMAQGPRPVRGHLLISHTHWDHIQGLPFFTPLFIPGNEWDIYAPGGGGKRLEETLSGQMEYEYFPINLGQLGATIRYHDLVEGVFQVGGVAVTASYLNHPALSLGYRLEVGGASVVYASDHEPHSRHQPDMEFLARVQGALGGGAAAVQPVHAEDRRHLEFLAGADLVIHDAQYTLQEYPTKIGWGHTPAERAVDFAVAADVRRLALFHHDPTRSDEALGQLVEVCRRRAADAGGTLEVFAAAEGQIVELPERAMATVAAATVAQTALIVSESGPADGEPPSVLIVDDDPDIVRLVEAALRPEKLRLLTALDGDEALAVALRERPDLVLLDWELPGRSGLDVCREIRRASDVALRNVPIVMITGHSGVEETESGFAAGVTDYLTKPFSPAHMRSRVRGWLLRARTGGTAVSR